MACCESFMKYAIFIVNLLTALVGLLVLGLGLAAHLMAKKSDVMETFNTLDPHIKDIILKYSLGIIVIGGIIFIVSFSGCCGSITKNSFLLIAYSVFLIVLIIIKLAIFTIILTKKEELVKFTNTELDKIFAKSFYDTKQSSKFHGIEFVMQCCGTTGLASYDLMFFSETPPTCCKGADEDFLKNNKTCDRSDVNIGCQTKIADAINLYSTLVAVGCIAAIAIQIVAVVFSVYLANKACNGGSSKIY